MQKKSIQTKKINSELILTNDRNRLLEFLLVRFGLFLALCISPHHHHPTPHSLLENVKSVNHICCEPNQPTLKSHGCELISLCLLILCLVHIILRSVMLKSITSEHLSCRAECCKLCFYHI